MKFFKSSLILILIVTFVSCKEMAIVSGLNERDANEIIVLLADNDISAGKTKEERQQETFWAITVPASDEIAARKILVANNLPRIRQGGLEGVCKDSSMIVTAETEKCRKLLAYKGEIINVLESIPGVVSADAVLNIPDAVEFPDENTPPPRPTAAVTLRYLKDANDKTDLTEGKIQETVANSISGLDARDVSVIISYLNQKKIVDEPITTSSGDNVATNQTQTSGPLLAADGTPIELTSIAGIQMDSKSAKKFKIVIVLFLLILLMLAGGFVYTLLKIGSLKKQSPIPATPAGTDNADDADQKLLKA